MNYKQYSEILHCIGVLEGIGTVLKEEISGVYYDTLAALLGFIDELKPEVTDERN